jgi:hypothetical protein
MVAVYGREASAAKGVNDKERDKLRLTYVTCIVRSFYMPASHPPSCLKNRQVLVSFQSEYFSRCEQPWPSPQPEQPSPSPLPLTFTIIMQRNRSRTVMFDSLSNSQTAPTFVTEEQSNAVLGFQVTAKVSILLPILLQYPSVGIRLTVDAILQ